MQALKGLVVGLGILIVIGFMMVIYGFYTGFANPGLKMTSDPSEQAGTPAADPATAQARNFGETRISLPEGCTLVEMRPDGDRLYLRTGPTGLCEQIIVVDPGNGEVLGTFVVKP